MKILLIYILIMGAGIALGYKTRFSSKSRTRDLFQKGCLLIILFLLCHQLGANEEVANSMTSMGLTGLLLCLAAMAGSFVVVCGKSGFVHALRNITAGNIVICARISISRRMANSASQHWERPLRHLPSKHAAPL